MRLDTSRRCPSHDPDHPVVRCDGARGHRPSDIHWAELGGKQYQWGPGLQNTFPSGPPSDLEPTSEYLASEIFTDGIKAAFIATQLIQHGEATCLRCGQTLAIMNDWRHEHLQYGSPEFIDAFAHALEEAMRGSHKHHVDRRRGHGYNRKKYGNDFGHDSPLLIEAPICEHCHTGRDSDIHPGPRFTRSST